AAEQIAAYLGEGKRALGAVPTTQTLVLERFFDESGGMQLVLHAPFGSRINRAWGLALRKKFCQGFNFELQAAATEEGVLLSLGASHSFALQEVFRYLHPNSVRETLVQAVLDSPIFETRWRWTTTLALAVPRTRRVRAARHRGAQRRRSRRARPGGDPARARGSLAGRQHGRRALRRADGRRISSRRGNYAAMARAAGRARFSHGQARRALARRGAHRRSPRRAPGKPHGGSRPDRGKREFDASQAGRAGANPARPLNPRNERARM